MTPLPRLAAPARRALDSAGIDQLEDLAKLRRSELEQLHGMGPSALRTIDDALQSAGLRTHD